MPCVGTACARPSHGRLAGYHAPMTEHTRPSLTLVLPAYNEAARLPAALDELFGYLGRERARTGRRTVGRRSWGRGTCSSWTMAPTDATAASSRRVPRRPRGPTAARRGLRVLRLPHGGKGAAVRAGMLAATGDLVVFADSDMATPPDQLPLLTEALADHDVALGSRVQPDGSGPASEPARLSADAGQGLPRSRRALGHGPGARTRSAASRASGARSARTCSRASGSRASCSTPRSSTSRAGAATPWPSCPSSGRTSVAPGCASGPTLALPGRCGTCCASRSSTGVSGRRRAPTAGHAASLSAGWPATRDAIGDVGRAHTAVCRTRTYTASPVSTTTVRPMSRTDADAVPLRIQSGRLRRHPPIGMGRPSLAATAGATPFSRWTFHRAWWDAYGSTAMSSTPRYRRGLPTRASRRTSSPSCP